MKAMDDALAGGPATRIAAALMKLISVTRRPSWMSDDLGKAYFETIQEAMLDYPVDVVEMALEAWRRGEQGAWWPAEAELRRVCEGLMEPCRVLRNRARSLLISLEAEEDRAARAAQPSAFAGDKGRAFRERMRAKMTERAFDCWFHPADILYRGDEIWVRTRIAETVLERDGRADLKELGLTVHFTPGAFDQIPERRSEPATPEEQAAFLATLNKLTGNIREREQAQHQRKAKLRRASNVDRGSGEDVADGLDGGSERVADRAGSESEGAGGVLA